MARRYEGRTVLVTGAAAGLGRARALGFAADGAALVLLALHPQSLAETPSTVPHQATQLHALAGRLF